MAAGGGLPPHALAGDNARGAVMRGRAPGRRGQSHHGPDRASRARRAPILLRRGGIGQVPIAHRGSEPRFPLSFWAGRPPTRSRGARNAS
ncbi:hypothetical protein, partial [Rhodovulum sulfidophilum]|uniref:hypothetical protein n=1 Tax=Rhodovulum sulfidophilum TaxID=35806 RepID=UPI001F2222D4